MPERGGPRHHENSERGEKPSSGTEQSLPVPEQPKPLSPTELWRQRAEARTKQETWADQARQKLGLPSQPGTAAEVPSPFDDQWLADMKDRVGRLNVSGQPVGERPLPRPAETQPTVTPDSAQPRSTAEAASPALDPEVEAMRKRISEMNVSSRSSEKPAPKPATERQPRPSAERPPRPVERTARPTPPERPAGPRQPERREAQRISIEQIVEAAKDKTVIHTDVPSGTEVRLKNGTRATRRGFQSFGDGYAGGDRDGALPLYLMQEINNPRGGMKLGAERPADLTEAVSFAYAAQPGQKEEPEYALKRSLLGRQQRVQVGTRTVPDYDNMTSIMVDNPATGKQERGVYFDYGYNPMLQGGNSAFEEDKKGYGYRESTGVRHGNMLVTRTLLPASLAFQLLEELEQNPTAAREVVHQLVTERGQLDEDVWEGSNPGLNPVRPPWDRLPADHPIYLVEQPKQLGGQWKASKLG